MRIARRYEVEENHALTAPDYEATATVAQAFDSITSRKFYTLLVTGMLWRYLREGARKLRSRTLRDMAKDVHSRLVEMSESFHQECNLEVIPIRKLVRVQLGSGLVFLDYMKSKEA